MEVNVVRKLKSKDGQIFEVEEKCLAKSTVLKGLINDLPDSEA